MGENKGDLGFWAITGAFVALWGALELVHASALLSNVWQASGKALWGGFLLSIGAYLIMHVIQKYRARQET